MPFDVVDFRSFIESSELHGGWSAIHSWDDNMAEKIHEELSKLEQAVPLFEQQRNILVGHLSKFRGTNGGNLLKMVLNKAAHEEQQFQRFRTKFGQNRSVDTNASNLVKIGNDSQLVELFVLERQNNIEGFMNSTGTEKLRLLREFIDLCMTARHQLKEILVKIGNIAGIHSKEIHADIILIIRQLQEHTGVKVISEATFKLLNSAMLHTGLLTNLIYHYD